MSSIHKKIKIEYYRYELTNTSTNTPIDYNIDNLFSTLVLKKIEDRIYELNNSKIRIEQIVKRDSFWLINVLKFRETDTAKTAKINEEATDLPLDDDEYLSEDMTVIYNVQEKIFAIQRNRFCCTPTQLGRYFEQILMQEFQHSKLTFKFIPIVRNNLDKALNNMVDCRKLTCKISDWPTSQEYYTNKSLSKIAKLTEEFEATSIEITVSVGRNRKKTLSRAHAKKFISEIINLSQANGNVQKAIASLNTSINEDSEDTKFEMFDLLSNNLHDIINFTLETRMSISFTNISSEMIKKFNKHILQTQFE